MDEPPSIRTSVISSLSLGLDSIEYLYQYYAGCRHQHHHLAPTADRLEDLLQSIRIINGVVLSRQWRPGDQTTIQTIEESITYCNDIINELKDEVQKFKSQARNSSSNLVRGTDRRAVYPLRESTLKKLDEDIAEFHRILSTALHTLQLQEWRNALTYEETVSHSVYRDQGATGQHNGRYGNINIDGYAQVHIGDTFIQNDMQEVEQLVNRVQAQNTDAELRRWLRAPDATVDLNNACARRHIGTGQWLVEGTAFTTWLQRDNSFLWMYGFAGCGKSVLCSTAIQHAFRHRQSCAPTDSAIAFFFFTFNDESKQDASAALRALLLQLCGQVSSLDKDLARLKKSYDQGTPPVPILLEYLRQAVTRCRHVYVLLDALDESPANSSRDEVLWMIETIRQWQLPGLHLLVTSRDAPDIRDSLQSPTPGLGGAYIALKNDSIQQDISRYVSFQVDNDRQLQRWGDYREKIKKHLTQHAGGVFRWVECQLRPLRKCARSEKHLERCLRALPQSLDETYERMLCELESWEEARQILSLLCFTARPLSIDEIAEALAVDTEELESYDPRSRFTGGADDLLRICPGLIEISLESRKSDDDDDSKDNDDKEDADDSSDTNTSSVGIEVVRVAHFSVQEYLLSDRIRKSHASDFALSGPSQHGWISKVCLLYLDHDDFLRQVLSPDLVEQYAFARYAAQHWHRHYREADSQVALQLSERVAAWLTNHRTFERWIRLYNPDHPLNAVIKYRRSAENCPSPIYYASLLGFDSVLANLLLMSTADVNAQGGVYGNALQAASWGGHKQVVQMLLDKGADVNVQGGKYGNALFAASAWGCEQVVQILLDKGADVNAHGGRLGNALRVASWAGHEQIVQILLDKGADVNTQGGYSSDALQAALRGGYKQVVQILLQYGAKRG